MPVLHGVQRRWLPQRKLPGRGNLLAGDQYTFDAVKKIWPFWIILFAIASVITLLWNIALKQPTARWRERIPLLRSGRPVVGVILE